MLKKGLNVSWKQHLTNLQLYETVPPSDKDDSSSRATQSQSQSQSQRLLRSSLPAADLTAEMETMAQRRADDTKIITNLLYGLFVMLLTLVTNFTAALIDSPS